LSERTIEWIKLDLPGEDNLVHLNRILLEEAYPDELDEIHEVRLKKIYAAIHRWPHVEEKSQTPAESSQPRIIGRAALCLSGGGIRSATFALGVLQGLARKGFLDQFDYLSTVSGGGYAGAWLTSWIHRHPEGISGVIAELQSMPDASVAEPSKPAGNGEARSLLEPEPAPIRHLRAYSNYLTPRLGAFSADTWTLVAIFLRNLFVNWLVLIPLITAVLMLPRFLVSAISEGASASTRSLVFVIGSVSAVIAVAYGAFNRPMVSEDSTAQKGFWRFLRTQTGFLVWCMAPLTTSAIALGLFWAWHCYAGNEPFSWWQFSLFGLVIHSAGWLLSAFISAWQETRPWPARLKSLFFRHETWVAPLTGLVGGWLIGWGALKVFHLSAGGAFPELEMAHYVCWAAPVFLTIFLIAATIFVAVTSRFSSDEDREWWGRMGAWTLIVVVGWTLVSSLVVFGPMWLLALSWKWKMIVSSAGGISGLIAVWLGHSSSTAANKDQGENKWGPKIRAWACALAAPLFLVFFLVLLSFLTNCLLGWLGTKTVLHDVFPRGNFLQDSYGPLRLLRETSWRGVTVIMMALEGFALLFGSVVNINKFSLHSVYRDRLTRAYLGASQARRKPNLFTGFDPNDNIQMRDLRNGLLQVDHLRNPASLVLKLARSEQPLHQQLREHLQLAPDLLAKLKGYDDTQPPSDQLIRRLVIELNRLLLGVYCYNALDHPPKIHTAFRQEDPPSDDAIIFNRRILESAFPDEIVPAVPPPRKPLHVVNMALNLVRGRNLAWQQRKAETFTVSTLHSGNKRLGYRRTAFYGRNAATHRAISLGTAITISGAAASPNMGYHSSPVITFLLTLFNVRLGWWLGNPGMHGQQTHALSAPHSSITPLVQEALGLTDDCSKYVYLSDGGHFENLGLYEMVLRRCQVIVVSDAGCDPSCSFEDLANAVRKIRIDLGVPIEFETLPIYPRDDPQNVSRYCAVGTIDYSAMDGPLARKGILIYLKPAVQKHPAEQPVDVFNYAHSSKEFPHEPTSDQFFSETQFESYRMLGFYTIQEIFRKGEITRMNREWSSKLNEFADTVEGYLRFK